MVKAFFNTVLYEPLFNLLVFFAWLVPGHSIGWAIILLTLTLKLLLWKLQAKQFTSQIEMRAHQDEIRALQERHKGDRAAQAQALTAYYKEHGISPFSGCLPLLIQLPILIVMYNVFRIGLHDLRPDLLYSFTPHLDSVNTHFFGINLANPDKIIMPLLAAAAQFFQSRHMMLLSPPPSKDSKDPAANMQRQMIYMLPAITFFIAFSLPAGLALYLTVSALFSVGQQEVLRRTYKPTKPNVTIKVRSKNK